ncbi:MAG: hypothetical protein II163_03325, partial [Ruminococcus sp.]|nr:hypothetical protein [Ruminococcus sp.]
MKIVQKKRAVKKQAIVIVRSDRRGNLPRYYLGFVGLPRAKALAMTAFFHSPIVLFKADIQL